ncbi:MAG TPA: hydroxysqualene dehydroxylase HpnE [Candidimonas sp.]|nr:hydroxysqualene dehydroxylase HpnE [Candidimonas sp.]
MTAAVIGGGWAGLSAAARLRQAGHDVVVFEASRTLGGRARRVDSRSLNASIDNGQHLLLGAYSETLALMRHLGLDPDVRFDRLPLTLSAADGSFALRVPALPAPLHLLGAILGAHGISLKERLAIAGMIQSLKRRTWITPPGQTVAQWLHQGRQSPHVVRMLWQPLCLAALNTPLDLACAQLFARVLKDSLGGPRDACDVLLPAVDLSSLWPDHVEQAFAATHGASLTVRRGHAVRQLALHGSGVQLDGEFFDTVVVAGNTPSTLRLLRQLPVSETGMRYLQMLNSFAFLPIATVTLQLKHAWRLPQAMLLLKDDPARLQFGQWLFDRDGRFNIVISDARALQAAPRKETIAAIIQQVREQTRGFGRMPDVSCHETIIEKRATFAAVPGLARPGNRTPWDRVWAAGDWTDTGYPGVLEGAVRSGRDAAALIGKA